MTMKGSDFSGLFGRLVVGGVLLYAGFMKAVGPSAEFAAAIAAYKILPSAWVTPLALGLPYVEMWVGLFVLTGFYTRRAALAAAALFILFVLTLASARVRGIDLASCGCFGSDTLSPRYTLILDTALLALSVMVYRLSKYVRPWSLDQALQ